MGIAVSADHAVPAGQGTIHQDRSKSEISSRLAFQHHLPNAQGWHHQHGSGTGIRPGPRPGLACARHDVTPASLDQPLGQFGLERYPQGPGQQEQ
jgi:hypothetical protein